MMVQSDDSRNLQQILIFALVPAILGILTLTSWLLGRWQVGPWLLMGPWQVGPGTLAAGLALIATFFGGWQRFLAGFRDVANRRVTVNVFVTVAIFVTIAVGEFLPATVIILIMAVVGALE